jgi:polysaccharide pyruvyl transferase WcaK-like protein
MNKSTNLLLLNDTTDWYHFGCTATSTALKENIVKLGYNLTSVPITETYKIAGVPSEWEDFQSLEVFESFSKTNPELINKISVNEIVIINGEGTLHGLRPAPLCLLYVAYIAKKFLHKNVQIINHSVYPQDDLSLTDPKIITIYKEVYNSLDFIAIREPLSFELVKNLGIPCEESFDCLPLYIKDHYKTSEHKKEKKILLIAGSAAWLHLNILADDRGNIEEFEKELGQFIAYIDEMATRGYEIKFLYGAQEYPAKDDRELISFIKPRLNYFCEIITAKSLTEWLSIVEQASLLVSGRFHHSLAAACLGTPFIALNSNTPKIMGLMKAIGHPLNLDYCDPDLKEHLLQLTESIQKSDNFYSLEDFCSRAMNNFSMLIGLAQKKIT